MREIFVAITLLLFVSGCSVGPTMVNISAPFDEAQAKSMLFAGSNTIEGSALIRQKGGGVVTCAGLDVSLIPATDYAEERIKAIYGSSYGGYVQVFHLNKIFNPDVPQYKELWKHTVCDSEGHFKFKNLGDGAFFAYSTITWQVGKAHQGGYIVKRVEVSGGETKETVLSP